MEHHDAALAHDDWIIASFLNLIAYAAPGALFTDSATMYDEADLNNAIELNLLEKKKKRVRQF